ARVPATSPSHPSLVVQPAGASDTAPCDEPPIPPPTHRCWRSSSSVPPPCGGTLPHTSASCPLAASFRAGSVAFYSCFIFGVSPSVAQFGCSRVVALVDTCVDD